MPSLVYFEVTADDLERAVQFYRNVFGWAISAGEGDDEYNEVETGTEEEPGVPGGVVPRLDAYEVDD